MVTFVEQFQTTGFDARIWELYLHAYLTDVEFSFLPCVSPDFIVTKGNADIGIEAVTANPTQGLKNGGGYSSHPAIIHQERQINEALKLDASFVDKEKDFVPMKLGSPLYSKLQKRYWDLPNMKERPLIFAIETFHDKHSLHYSSTGLTTYLYGYRFEHIWDAEGRLLIVPVKVNSHSYAGRTIPSGFFYLPNAQHISAVLFSNSGTLSKFNRMGHQNNHHNPRIRLFRQGSCYNPDPNSASPLRFSYEIGDPQFVEWWGQGLEMFHNPNAIHPIERWLFPGIAHHRLENGTVYTEPPTFHPISSFTLNVAKNERLTRN